MLDVRPQIHPADLAFFRSRMERIGAAVPRAVAFALNGVNKQAEKALTRVLETRIDEPMPFTKRAVGRKYADLKVESLDAVEASVFVKDGQSPYLKFPLAGQPVTTRRPGDVGASSDQIYIPVWGNLSREGVRAQGGENMPRNTLRKFMRLAGRGGARPVARRGKPTYFLGAPVINGVQRGNGLWVRPAPIAVPGGPARRPMPRMLVRTVDETRHRNFLRRPWDEATLAAAETIGPRLEAQLRNALAFRDARATGSDAQTASQVGRAAEQEFLAAQVVG